MPLHVTFSPLLFSKFNFHVMPMRFWRAPITDFYPAVYYLSSVLLYQFCISRGWYDYIGWKIVSMFYRCLWQSLLDHGPEWKDVLVFLEISTEPHTVCYMSIFIETSLQSRYCFCYKCCKYSNLRWMVVCFKCKVWEVCKTMTLDYHWLRNIARSKAGYVIVPAGIIDLYENSMLLTG